MTEDDMTEDEYTVKLWPSSALPCSPAARLDRIMDLLSPRQVIGDDGEPTGEMSPPLLDIGPDVIRTLLESKWARPAR